MNDEEVLEEQAYIEDGTTFAFTSGDDYGTWKMKEVK